MTKRGGKINRGREEGRTDGRKNEQVEDLVGRRLTVAGHKGMKGTRRRGRQEALARYPAIDPRGEG